MMIMTNLIGESSSSSWFLVTMRHNWWSWLTWASSQSFSLQFSPIPNHSLRLLSFSAPQPMPPKKFCLPVHLFIATHKDSHKFIILSVKLVISTFEILCWAKFALKIEIEGLSRFKAPQSIVKLPLRDDQIWCGERVEGVLSVFRVGLHKNHLSR